MDCNVLEETDYAGLPGIRERPGAVPYRPGPAMCDLVEQSDLIGAYQTCIHATVHVPYGWDSEQAYAANMPQYQIVVLHVRRKTEELARKVG